MTRLVARTVYHLRKEHLTQVPETGRHRFEGEQSEAHLAHLNLSLRDSKVVVVGGPASALGQVSVLVAPGGVHLRLVLLLLLLVLVVV
jgi:hypothetical protein